MRAIANVGLAMNFDLAPDGKRFAVLMPGLTAAVRAACANIAC